ncbi:MAG: DUF4965 domain-containing protein [Bacteroidales bacterium]|nr:DUF4965 domain-containing protein [Bacteroidales bacterium]
MIKNLLLAAALFAVISCSAGVDPTTDIRPSATPLVTVDPFLSIWSMTDELTADQTRHFCLREYPLVSAVRVDRQVYRVLGQSQPHVDVLLPSIALGQYDARYVMDRKPSGDWTAVSYNDSAWTLGPGAFGSRDEEMVGTPWAGPDRDIWVRRAFDLSEDLSSARVLLEYSHDDTFELYVNGVKVVDTGYDWKHGVMLELPAEAAATLKPGKNVIAAHCHNTVGGAYVDFGLFKIHDSDILETAAVQKDLDVLPTRTIYTFGCGPVDVKLTFTAPALMDDLERMSRPINYISWTASATDGSEHEVQVYFEASPLITIDQMVPVTASVGSSDGVDFAMAGSVEQKGLKRGDRRNWGYLYIASAEGKGSFGLYNFVNSQTAFQNDGKLPESPATTVSSNLRADGLVLAYQTSLGKVGSSPVSDFVMIGYDEEFSIEYFEERLRAYWNKLGDKTLTSEFKKASDEYGRQMKRCEKFDREMFAEAQKVGGKNYAELCAVAYRQAIAAHKLVQAANGELLWMSRENFSGGFINTLDVTYPSTPLFLIYNTDLVKGMLNGIFHYSESGMWKQPFAAHDLGGYPFANGQTYGGNMPVEESGNALIICAAIAKIEKNASYAAKHWETLGTWADYLVQHGQDPVNQLCTDDFAGHFAHNANLSIKAIEGVASYAMLAGMLGYKEKEASYMDIARKMAAKWEQMAFDGDHYKLTFDREGTWSQKYNLVWDKLLGLNVFDPKIAQTEIAYYLGKQNVYGLPLDNRKMYTKTDWIMWTATMAEDRQTFEAFIDPIYKFENETVDRVPMSDWTRTNEPKMQGFRARSVVGGYWMKVLADRLTD